MTLDPVTNWLRAAKWWLFTIGGAVLLTAAIVFHLSAVKSARDEGALEERSKWNADVTAAITDATKKFTAAQAQIADDADAARQTREIAGAARAAGVAAARATLKEQTDALLAAVGCDVPVGMLDAINAARAAAQSRAD